MICLKEKRIETIISQKLRILKDIEANDHELSQRHFPHTLANIARLCGIAQGFFPEFANVL
jgi:hypothetical protein